MVAPPPPSLTPARFPWRAGVQATVYLTWLLALFALTTPLTAAEVTATLNPESVPAGQGATLTIRIVNGDVTALNAPEVPGLIFQGPNQGRQVNMVNGVTTSSMTLTYAVGSMTAGDYTIPPFTVTVDGAGVQTQPLKLKVTPSAAQTPAGLPPGGATGQPSAPPAPTAGDENLGFLTVELAGKVRKHAWVGEIAPVRIKAWLPAEARVSLNSPLQPEGSSFTLHNLSSQPQQGMEDHQGQRYLVATWYGGLSATKAGDYPPDLSMKISVQVPDRSGQGRRSNDPIFDRFFARMIQKEVTLRSKTDDSTRIEIRALPAEGRPDGFEGAVGKFTFGRTHIPAQWKTGEPQQITAEVEGEGNFKLLQQPVLKSGRDWKSYEGQSNFTAKDAASFSGTSIFRFSQVPRQSGSEQVRLTFSYFDPDAATYKTAETPPQAIEVTGTDLPPEPETVTLASAPLPAPPAPALAPQRTRAGFATSLTPLVWRPSFRLFLGLAGMVMITGLIVKFLRTRWRDPQRLARAAQEKALRSALQETETFAARGDVPGFFAAARRALQVRLASVWQTTAPAITLADVTHRLPGDSPIISFFQEADRQEYSRLNTLQPNELAIWRTHFRQALESIPPVPTSSQNIVSRQTVPA